MAVNLADPSLNAAIRQLQKDDCRYDHIVIGYRGSHATLYLYEVAAGGLKALTAKLQRAEPMFSLFKIDGKLLLILVLGRDISGVRRARSLVHARSFSTSLGSTIDAFVSVSSAEELTPALVKTKLKLKGWKQQLELSEAGISPRFSDYSSIRKPLHLSTLSLNNQDISTYRPTSENGLLIRYDEQEDHPVDLPLEKPLPPKNQSRILAWRAASELAFSSDPSSPWETPDDPRVSFGNDSEAASTIRPSDSGSVIHDRRLSHERRVGAPDDPAISSPDESQSTEKGVCDFTSERERQRKSAERARIRADEAIREEVMRKLRAEQGSDPSNERVARSPRPPLAPPPDLALPPTPTSLLSNRPGTKSPLLPPHTLRLNKPTPKIPSTSQDEHKREEEIGAYASPTRSTPVEPRISESNESIQTTQLWKFASPESLPSRKGGDFPAAAPNSVGNSPNLEYLAENPGKVGDITIFANIRAHRRLLDESSDDAEPWIMKHSRDDDRSRDERLTTPQSNSAPSIFDKDLPPPPQTAEDDTILTSPSSIAGDSRDDLEQLRLKAIEARIKAVAAEAEAKIEIEKAKFEQRRLQLELEEAARKDRERVEMEGIRRAKWAREQVERDKLDAFERSKLESAERRRRQAEQLARQEELDKTAAKKREKEQREREEAEALEMAERRRKDAVEREARLLAEVQANEERRKRLEDKAQRKIAEQESLIPRFAELDQKGDVVLNGFVTVQPEDSLAWKRRWFEVENGSMKLFKGKDDKATPLIELSLRGRVTQITDGFDECQVLNSLKLVLRSKGPAEPMASTCAERKKDLPSTWLLQTDTEAESLSLAAALHVVSSRDA